ncbi:hypothetical protein [Cellulomonas phragmiteti]|uniref:hypothetical protein n=1 Tax=Cellulomonas phragmiteti TaxID=478780 RepID=UPI001EF1AD98|nr:hypothetical protein [Cellulomonas phragmiteti]
MSVPAADAAGNHRPVRRPYPADSNAVVVVDANPSGSTVLVNARPNHGLAPKPVRVLCTGTCSAATPGVPAGTEAGTPSATVELVANP